MIFDLAIIGGGPAGLSAALYALRGGAKVVIFEGKGLGGTLNIVEEVANYPAIMRISGPELAKKMTKQVQKLKPTIIKQFVSGVNRDENGFTMYTSNEEYQAKRVILCTGLARTVPKCVADFEGAGISFCAVCDGNFNRGKDVAVYGDGYVAEEDVVYLSKLCNKVYWISKKHGEKSGINLEKNVELVEGVIESLEGDDRLRQIILRGGAKIAAHTLFVAQGALANSDLIDALKDENEGENEEICEKSGAKMGKIGERAYMAGDISNTFKQIVYACSAGALAATEIMKE